MTMLYLITFVIKPSPVLDLTQTLTDIRKHVSNASVTIIYEFKVAGEQKVLMVVEVEQPMCLEQGSMNKLSQLELVTVTCQPVIEYVSFARMLGVDEKLLEPIPLKNTRATDVYLLDADVEYHGKTMEELLTIWKNEATSMLTARAKDTDIVMFKVVGQRKVVVFLRGTPEEMDKMSFTIPIQVANGHNLHQICRSLVDLSAYIETAN